MQNSLSEPIANGTCSADGLCNGTGAIVASSTVVDVENARERSCDTLIMCILTTFNKGLRSGGGIGDVLRKSSSKVYYALYLQYQYMIGIIAIIPVLIR